MESMNSHLQGHPYISFNRSYSCIVHPSSLFNLHQHLPRVWDKQAHTYNQYTQVVGTPLWLSLCNLQPSDTYPSRYLDPTSIILGVNQSFDEVIMYSTFLEVSYLVLRHSDSLVRSEPDNRRPGPDTESCSSWSRYTGDLNTDLWDYSKVRVSSCSEDQMAIRFQNRVISYECLLLYYFLIYGCQ